MKDFGRLFNFKWILTTIMVLIGAAVCVRLGFWQLDRLSQRRAFNAHYILMNSLDPIDLTSAENLENMEYRHVVASGAYDFAQQIALRNQYFQDQYGYHLLTPLVMKNGNAVLVDRGWIPASGNEKPSDWNRYDKSGIVNIQGIIRLARTKADFIGTTDPELAAGQTRLDIWTFPNIPRIQEQTNYDLLPVYIQLDVDQSVDNPPIPYQPVVELTEGPHFGYALQWFTFAGILVIGYPLFVNKQLKSPGR
jgi:surfeit locus 1 family protein